MRFALGYSPKRNKRLVDAKPQIAIIPTKCIWEGMIKTRRIRCVRFHEQRWKFIKENRRVRKKKENTLSTKNRPRRRSRKKELFFLGRFLGRECAFFLFFLDLYGFFSFFLGRSPGRERVFFPFSFFLIAFLVGSVFSYLRTLLFSFKNSHLAQSRGITRRKI